MDARIRTLATIARGLVLLLAVGLGIPLLALHQLQLALVTLPVPPAG